MDKSTLEKIFNTQLTDSGDGKTFSFPTSWKIADSFSGLKKSLTGTSTFKDTTITIDSNSKISDTFQTQFDFPLQVDTSSSEFYTGLKFSTTIQLSTDNPIGQFLSNADIPISGAIEIYNNSPRFWLKSTDSQTITIGDFNIKIHLQLVGVLLEVTSDDKKTYQTVDFFNFGITFSKGSSFTVPCNATLISQENFQINIKADTTEISKKGFDELNTVFSDCAMSQLLEPASSLLTNISIASLSLGVDLSNKKISSIGLGIAYTDEWTVFDSPSVKFKNLKGVITVTSPFDKANRSYDIGLYGEGVINNKTIQAYFSPTTLAFSLNFNDDKGFDMTSVIQAIMPASLNFPGFTCTSFSLSGATKQNQYAIAAEISEDWSIMSDQLTLKKTGFNLAYDPSNTASKVSGTINAVFNIASIDIVLVAEKNTDGGWQFSGETLNKDGINLSQLRTDCQDKLNFTLPSFFDHITIGKISLAYDVANKTFDFAINGTFDIDGATIDISTTLKTTNNATTKALEVQFTGKIKVGDYEFDINYDKNSNSQSLIALFDNTSGDKINIKNLISKVSSDIGDLIPDSFEIGVKNILLAIGKNSATTGTTTNKSKFLFGINISADVSLKDLPLVGKSLQGDANVGIDSIQALVASTDFTQEEISNINKTVPKDAINLPSTAMVKGLQLSTSFNIAGTISSVSLPTSASANGSSTTNQPTQTEEGMWISINKALGPVQLNRVGLKCKDTELWLMFDIAMTTGGLTIALNGLGASSPLSEFNPTPYLNGLGLDYKNPPVEIGGDFIKKDDSYIGSAIIKTANFNISALGEYTSKDGYNSVFVFALMDQPLGGPSFFFVTGLAAGFGYNQQFQRPTLDKLTKFPLIQAAMSSDGTTTNPFSSKQPGPALTKLGDYLSPKQGEDWLAAGVRFTSFEMIKSFALLMISFGTKTEIDLLGTSEVAIPKGASNPIAKAEIALIATYNPDEGVLKVNGKLTNNSYVISKDCKLTGGFAFYTWFTGNNEGDFVLTLGGYHPKFKLSNHPNYPDVDRLAINWRVNGNMSIKGDAYFALTPNCLMAGGGLSATWKKGDLKAWFDVDADFLLVWKPFHYEIDAHIRVGVSYKLHLVVTTKTITVHVGVDLSMWGPPFGGKAHVDLSIFSFTISFGSGKSSPGALDWSDFKTSFLPAANQNSTVKSNNTLASSATTTTNSITMASASGGLLKDYSGQDDATIDWIMDPDQFAIETSSLIPSKKGSFNSTDQSHNGNTNFGVEPMKIVASNGLTSEHMITITTHEGKKYSDFSITPIYNNSPSGMWSPKSTGLNSDALVTNTLKGFKISSLPHSRDQLLPIELETLWYQVRAKRNFLWTDPNIKKTDSFDQSKAMNTMKTSLKDDTVKTKRNNIITALTNNGLNIENQIDIGNISNDGEDYLLSAPVLSYLAEEKA